MFNKGLIIVWLFWSIGVIQASSLSGKINVHPLYTDKLTESAFAIKVITDEQGFLWISTDNGLQRYDGYNVVHFSYNKDIPTSVGSNSISTLYLDNQNVLWAGGERLSQYHRDTETFSHFDPSQGAAIWSMHKAENDIVWVGGQGFGLRAFDLKQNKVIHQFLAEGNDRFINAIVPDETNSNLLIGSNGGIYQLNLDDLEIQQVFAPQDLGLDNFVLRDMTLDNQGQIWLATEYGVIAVNRSTNKVRHYLHDPQTQHSLSSNVIWSIFKDSEGLIWIGTDKQGVNIFDPETDSFSHIPSSVKDNDLYAFPPTSIYDIYQDAHGTLWFTTASYGVRRISRYTQNFDKLKHIQDEPNSLGFNNVLDIYQDSKGIIWIATDGGGLDKYDPLTGQFSHYRHDVNDPASISSDSVIAIDEDVNGKLWIGTYSGGLNIFDPENETFERILADKADSENKTLKNNNIFDIHYASESLILISVWRFGLQIYDAVAQTFDTFSPGGIGAKSGISNFNINVIEPALEGKYWIGGHSGLELFDPATKTFEHIAISGVEVIYDIFTNEDNSLWIATQSGLVHFDLTTSASQIYSEEHGVADSFVVSIEKDFNNNLWLGTRNGLTRFDVTSGAFKSFTVSEGLSSNQFNRYSHLHAKDGRMFFGGTSGINVFEPLQLQVNTNLPEVVLTSLEINQEPILIGKDSILSKSITQTDQLTLEYFQNNMTFEFAGLNFISPNKNQYKYRLIGFENDWKLVNANNRRVRYTNLDAGEYGFEVMGSNNEGIWNPEVTRINIKILPPWWETMTARVAFTLSFLIILTYIIHWRSRKVQQRARDLELLVEKRTSELNLRKKELEISLNNLQETQNQLVESKKVAALGRLVVGISHEINTPLGVCMTATSHMQNTAEALFKKYDDKQLKASDFDTFRSQFEASSELSLKNIRRAAELVQSFKQIAVDKSADKMTEFSLQSFIVTLLSIGRATLKGTKIQLMVECKTEVMVTGFPNLLNNVLVTLVENSKLHAFEKGEKGDIWITATVLNDNEICICYRDNGKGIPAEYREQICEPFFTTNRRDGNVGLGMHLIHNIVSHRLRGKFVICDPEEGVEFQIILPIESTDESPKLAQ